MTDEREVAALVIAAVEGDRSAWDLLVDRFAGLVWAVIRAYRLAPTDSSDVFQTVWLRALEQLGALREPDRLAGWLGTTTRRECLRVLRASRREAATAVEVLDLRASAESPLESRVLRRERDEILWRCLASGPGTCRELLLVLTAEPAPSYAEVALALDMPVGSIGPTRRRCLDQLRARLAEAGVDAET